jgi:hypothetical protein
VLRDSVMSLYEVVEVKPQSQSQRAGQMRRFSR